MAKVLVTAVLENVTEKKFFSTETLGILESNKIKFIDDNKVTVVIEIKDNHLVMTRRSEDYEIVLPFNPKCKEEGKYCVKGIGNLHLDVETTNLVINPANLLVEYNMILDGETESKFKYTIKYEESK